MHTWFYVQLDQKILNGLYSQTQPLKKATSTNLEEPVPLASAIKATSAVALAFSDDKNALEEPSGPVKSSPTPHTVSFHEFRMKWKQKIKVEDLRWMECKSSLTSFLEDL